ncbi:hypothetical protein RCL1_001641 [Eukaryota sp. TZLM3-RCL]
MEPLLLVPSNPLKTSVPELLLDNFTKHYSFGRKSPANKNDVDIIPDVTPSSLSRHHFSIFFDSCVNKWTLKVTGPHGLFFKSIIDDNFEHIRPGKYTLSIGDIISVFSLPDSEDPTVEFLVKKPPSSMLKPSKCLAGTKRLSSTLPAVVTSAPSALTDSLKELLTCGVCLDILANPVQLNCGHVLCSECVHAWMTSARKTCPTCRQKVTTTSKAFIIAEQVSRFIIPTLDEQERKELEDRINIDKVKLGTVKHPQKKLLCRFCFQSIEGTCEKWSVNGIEVYAHSHCIM